MKSVLKEIKLWGLIRVSSVEQSKTQYGSLDAQEATHIRSANQLSNETGIKHEIVRFVREVKSGRKSKSHLRTTMDEVIHAFRNDLCDGIMVESVSRLGRWQKQNLEIIEAAVKYNKYIFIGGNRYDHLSKGDRIKFGIENLMAEEESNDTSERVLKKQREAMVNSGKDSSTIPTLGLNASGKFACIYDPNWSELKIVVDLMERFCSTGSYAQTVIYSREKNYVTKVRFTKQTIDKHGEICPPRRIGGDPFNESKLRALLVNPKYRGTNSFQDTYNQFPNLQDENGTVKWEYAHHRKHGPLIPSELIQKVDQTIESFKRHKPRRSKFGQIYLLTKVLKDHLGNPFYGGSAKGGSYFYYYNKTKNKDERKSVRKEEIENIVCERVKQYLQESGTLENIMSAAVRNKNVGLPLIEEEIPRAKSEIDRLEKVVARFGSSRLGV